MEVAHLILFILISLKSSFSLEDFGNCDFFQRLTATSQFTIVSTGYPQNYLSNTKCRWAAEAPMGYKVSLNCYDVRLPSSLSCANDLLSVSPSGRADLSDGKRFCGNSPFQVYSTSYRMTIAHKVGPFSKGGKFRCDIKAVKNYCSCGVRNRGRIGEIKSSPQSTQT